MTYAVDHRSIRRVDGVFIQIERAARIHNAVIDTVADEQCAVDLAGSSDQGKLLDLFARVLQIFGAHEPAQAFLDRRIIVENIIDKIVGAAPHRDGLDTFFYGGAARS